MANELTIQKKKDIQNLLAANMKAIKNVLPRHLTPERAMRIAFTAITQSPALANCSQVSLLNAVIEASMLGLEIGGPLGHAYLIPFGQTATLIIGYRGFMDLAYRSNQITNFAFHPVYEKDHFNYSYGLKPHLEHVPSEDPDPGPLKYAYAVVNFKNGGSDFEVVTKTIAMATKERSAAKNKKDSPWNTEDEWTMWCKTAVRRLAKRIPLSSELQRAAMLDEQADAGVGQGINHIIDIDFADAGDSAKLTKQLKGEAKQDTVPIDFKKLHAHVQKINPDISTAEIEKIANWHLSGGGSEDELYMHWDDVMGNFISAN